MVMVYTHPMVSYISNFSRADRNVPASAVFSTWRNVYQKIAEYNKLTNGNFSLFANDHGGRYKKEIEGFNTAAKNGVNGVKDYLKSYNEKNGIEGSSFFKPVDMSSAEQQEFEKATVGLDYDKESRSEDKAIKKEFLKYYTKNGVGPGLDVLQKARDKYRDTKAKFEANADAVLDNIIDMIFEPKFMDKIIHSSPKEIDQKVQAFLK